MKQPEAKKHSQLCSVLHLNLLLTYVLRLEEQVKHQLGAVNGACGGGVTDEWMRSSERFISNAISRIDTVISETTDLRKKLADHNQRLAFLEGRITSEAGLPIASKHTSLPSAHLPEDIARRLMNAENGTNDMEFLLSETGREVNGVKQEVKYHSHAHVYSETKIIWQCHICLLNVNSVVSLLQPMWYTRCWL